MSKTLQRDVNLARKLNNIAFQSQVLASYLLDPQLSTQQIDVNFALKALEESLLDTYSFSREYRRKVSPIEIKGQRA